MNVLGHDWNTLETAEAFWQLTETPALVAFLRHYPAPAYNPDHVEALIRLCCLVADVDTEGVEWAQLTEAILSWACRQGLDIVEERGRKR